jgi:hypothetical protein
MRLLSNLLNFDPIAKALKAADELQAAHTAQQQDLANAIRSLHAARKEAARSYNLQPSGKALLAWVTAAANAQVVDDQDFTNEAETIMKLRSTSDWAALANLVEPARVAAVEEIKRQIDQIKASITESRDSVGLPAPTAEIIEAEPAIKILVRRKETLESVVPHLLGEGKIHNAINSIRSSIS